MNKRIIIFFMKNFLKRDIICFIGAKQIRIIKLFLEVNESYEKNEKVLRADTRVVYAVGAYGFPRRNLRNKLRQKP